ncbi:MAG: putative polysaccharide biosynthesis protein [Christensenellales bacterium]
MSDTKKSFIRGAAILGIAGLIVKIIGAFYRIPLTGIIGADGMGVYQITYPIYTYLLVVSISGVPAAISKMVSERIALGHYKAAHKVFTVSMKILFVIGFISMLALLLGGDLIAGLLGDPLAGRSMQMIAPALLLVALVSVFRGYFQGMQNMTPTAVSQIVEQLVKLAAGLYLASTMYNAYLPQGHELAISYGAAGAMLGVSLSELAALVLLFGLYNAKRREIRLMIRTNGTTKEESTKHVAKTLAKIAIPITIGASITPLIGMIDAAIINNKLIAIGFAEGTARSMYGVLTGVVNTLVNMPAVLTVALSTSMVPAITESRTMRDFAGMRAKLGTGLKMTMLIGLPCALGIGLLAEPILSLLYPTISNVDSALAVQLLEVMAVSILFVSFMQSSTGMLQGMGKVYVPVFNLFIGAIIKIVLTLIFMGMPKLNIMGAVLGSIACYGTAGVLNAICVIRLGGVKLDLVNFIIKPLFSGAVMAGVIYLCTHLLVGRLGNSITLAVSIIAAVVVYVLLILLTKTLNKADLDFMPGGRKIGALMRKFNLLK